MIEGVVKDSAATASWKTYFALCKPKVVSLIVFTAVVGILLASAGDPPWARAFIAILGIGLAAGAGAAANHWIDRRIDAVMARTQNRPLPQHQIKPASAVLFTLVLATFSMLILVTQVNWLTAWLTFISMIGRQLLGIL